MCHGETRCPEGGCSGSPASLMQIKSLNKRLKLSSGASSSDHSRTLAGFQKYVEDLVDAYQKGASSGLQKGTVDLIRDYLVQLWNTFWQEHHRDKKMRDWCGTPAMSNTKYKEFYYDSTGRCDACGDLNDDTPGEFCSQCAQAKGFDAQCILQTTGAIDEGEKFLNDTKREHDDCRRERYEDCTNEACRYFDKYRGTKTWTWSEKPGVSVDFSFEKCYNTATDGVLVGGIRGMNRTDNSKKVLTHEDQAINANRDLKGLNDVNYGVISTTWFHHWDSDEAGIVNHVRRKNMLPMGWTHHGNDEVHRHEVCSVNTGETPFLPACVKFGHVLPSYMRAGRQDNGKVAGIEATYRQVAIGTGITPTSNLVMFEKCLVAIRAWLGPRSSCYDQHDGTAESPDPWGYTIEVPNQGAAFTNPTARAWSGNQETIWNGCTAVPGTKDAKEIPGLWPLLRACKAPRDKTENKGSINHADSCGKLQTKFEEAHCNYYQLIGYHCYELDQCVKSEEAACGRTNYQVTGDGPDNIALGAGGAHKLESAWEDTGFLNASGITKDSEHYHVDGTYAGGTCGDIQKRVEQRQSDNETMEHIDCLLAALIAATEGDTGTADQFSTGVDADLTFTSADGAEKNQNSLRNSRRCTATFVTTFNSGGSAAEEGAECVCASAAAYTDSDVLQAQQDAGQTTAADFSDVLLGQSCKVGGEDVNRCDCTEWNDDGRSTSVGGGSYIGQEVAIAQWNKERANATMRFCKGENYRAPKGTADDNIVDADGTLIDDTGAAISGGKVEYRWNGTWSNKGFVALKDLVDAERARVHGDTNYHAGLEIAEKYDYFSVSLTGITKNFKHEMVSKWVQWLIPCKAICSCEGCDDKLKKPPCTEGVTEGVKGFKDEYYTLEEKNFDIDLPTNLEQASVTHGGPYDSGSGVATSGHVPERHGDNIYAIPSKLADDFGNAWLNLNKDYSNDNNPDETFPSIPRGFEYNVVQTGEKCGESAGVAACKGAITVAFESDLFPSKDYDGSAYDNTAGQEEEGYRVWNRAACWDVQMCDTTSQGTTRDSGKCHSYYSWYDNIGEGVTTNNIKCKATSSTTATDGAAVTVDEECVCASAALDSTVLKGQNCAVGDRAVTDCDCENKDSTVAFHDSIVNSDKTQFIGEDTNSSNDIDITHINDDTASMRADYSTTINIIAADVDADATETTEELAAKKSVPVRVGDKKYELIAGEHFTLP